MAYVAKGHLPFPPLSGVVEDSGGDKQIFDVRAPVKHTPLKTQTQTFPFFITQRKQIVTWLHHLISSRMQKQISTLTEAYPRGCVRAFFGPLNWTGTTILPTYSMLQLTTSPPRPDIINYFTPLGTNTPQKPTNSCNRTSNLRSHMIWTEGINRMNHLGYTLFYFTPCLETS